MPHFILNAAQSTLVDPAAQAPLTQAQSNPRSVVDQFYKAYVANQYWRDLKDLIDPATYDQLSRIKMFDVEPFTGAQVLTWNYTIEQPRIKDSETKVPIRLMIGLRGASALRNLTIILRKNGQRWQLQNVIYSTKPLPSGEPNDLLHLWQPKP